MTQNSWHLKELLKLCPPHVIEEAKSYVKSIQAKLDRIIFSVEKLSAQTTPILRGKVELRKTQIATEIYLESIAYNLHSMADVLAHIIYFIVLCPLGESLKEKEINIKKIKTTLNKVNNKPREQCLSDYLNLIIQKIDSLLNSTEYRYIEALVNTIKHRQIIDTEYLLHLSQGQIRFSDWKLDSFKKDGVDYPSISSQDLYISYREKIIDDVCQIGQEINNYCRAYYNIR